jgi:hypothetical protein
MLKIKEEELNVIIHNMLSIIANLKAVENDSLTKGQKEIIHGCETRLMEIRQHILESVTENNTKEVE